MRNAHFKMLNFLSCTPRYRDNVNTAWLMFVGSKQWMSLRAEVLSALFVTVVAFASFFSSIDKGALFNFHLMFVTKDFYLSSSICTVLLVYR